MPDVLSPSPFADATEFLELADRCEKRANGHGMSGDRECLMEASIAIRALCAVLSEERVAAQDAAKAEKAVEAAKVPPATPAVLSGEPQSSSDPNPPQTEAKGAGKPPKSKK